MTDTVSMLFEQTRSQFPYQPVGEAEQLLDHQAEELYQQLAEQYPALHHELWLFRDRLQILDFYHCQHFFALGLDLGFSLARELALLTDTGQ